MQENQRRRLQIGGLGMLIVIAISVVAFVVVPRARNTAQQVVYTRPARATGADWSSALMDNTNSSYNTQEKTLTIESLTRLRLVGTYEIGDTTSPKDSISTSVLTSGNTLYFGSWDGYEYAVDASTFALRWRVNLGVDTPPIDQQCFPQSAGIGGTPTIAGQNLYVGGGNGSVYDLNPQTGSVIWQTNIATPPNEFLWSSPVLANNHIYIGVASFGDCPLIAGRVEMLDASTGVVQKVHFTVPGDQTGNSIWSKGLVDAADHAVIFAVGNGPVGNPESQSVIALNWDTLVPLPQGIWTIPADQLGGDSDFGAACTLVPDIGHGQHGIICHNKNGRLYALAANPSGLSLSWSLKIGRGGDGPEHDQGDISGMAFDGAYLYASTEQLTYKGETYPSAIYKIDPATSKVLWMTPIEDFFSLVSVSGANGFLVIGLTDTHFNGAFDIIDTATGNILYSQILSAAVLAPPTIADGEILIPTADGHLYVYATLPEPSLTESFMNGSLPADWSWTHYNPKAASFTSAGVALTASAQSSIDSTNMLTRSLPAGDLAVETVVNNPLANGSARAGIVLYASPGNMVTLTVYAQTPTHKTFELADYIQGKMVSQNIIDDPVGGEGNVHLLLFQMRNHFYGYSSRDNVHWLKMGDFTAPLAATIGGVGVFSPGQAMVAPATFSWCQVTSLNG